MRKSIPRPEHPMPQAQRAEWLNLNGVWEFAETDDSADARFLADAPYPDRITVPFCRESRLSGLERRGFVTNVWYRRSLEKPAGWSSPRTLLHFGASDWKTRVWLNGTLLGEHVGGNAPFSFEITGMLRPGENTLIVHAFDDTRSGKQAIGKQCAELESRGCSYTRTTGIWQTVWLEGVGESFISDFHIQPDPDRSRILLQVETDGPCEGLRVVAIARAGANEAGRAVSAADWRNARLEVELSEKHLWSPRSPYLYDLELHLVRDGRALDQVTSYFGLRKVSVRGAAVLLNDRAVFQRLVLDQGFYPDGVWTAPTDGDLRRDIELSQAAGFNGARLHEKVFEPRFLYWADRMGYLVWGEYPNWGLDYTSESCLQMPDEWADVVRRDRNHPSIVGWCPFNETPTEAVSLQNAVVKLTRLLDPSRPVIDTSGWSHGLPDPEILDDHDYDQDPESYRARWLDSFRPDIALPERYNVRTWSKPVPFFISEYGGIGWKTEGGWGYGVPKTEEEFYSRHKGLTDVLLDNRFMFGFCYTQLYDIEQEQNGFYYYDRTPKLDIGRLHDANVRQAAYEADPPIDVAPRKLDWQVLVGGMADGDLARPWRFTISEPPDGWTEAGFDDSRWNTGLGGFGSKPGLEWGVRTPWDTGEIWLRQEFESPFGSPCRMLLVARSEGGGEVYVNGEKVLTLRSWVRTYEGFDISGTAQGALRDGKNVVAVHCLRGESGNYADFALLVTDGEETAIGGR